MFWIFLFQIALYLYLFTSIWAYKKSTWISTTDPPSPLVDLHGYLENPPSPLGHPHGLWMFPSDDPIKSNMACQMCPALPPLLLSPMWHLISNWHKTYCCNFFVCPTGLYLSLYLGLGWPNISYYRKEKCFPTIFMIIFTMKYIM